MAKKNFTDKTIAALKPREKKYYEREARGFALEVRPTGRKTFVYIYSFEGQRKYFLCGVYGKGPGEVSLKEARDAYSAAYAKVIAGIDPQAEMEETKEANKKKAAAAIRDAGNLLVEAGNLLEGTGNLSDDTGNLTGDEVDTTLPDAPTVRDMARAWLCKYSKPNHSKEWFDIMKLCINNEILPVMGHLPVTSIGRRAAINLIEDITARAPGMARNVMKAAQGIFEYAASREYIMATPFTKITKHVPKARQKPKRRRLSEKEIRKMWGAVDAGPGADSTKRALKMILMTMQRPSEVAQMHSDQIEGCWWTVPEMIVGNKTERENHVYLNPLALSLIGNREGFIFPGAGKEHDKPITRHSISKMVSRGETTKEVAKITKAGKKQTVRANQYYGMIPWTPHDLRRTGRTMLAAIGIGDEVGEEVVNHAKKGVKGIYNLYEYDDEKKEALTKWNAKMIQILNTPEERLAEAPPEPSPGEVDDEEYEQTA